MSPYPARAVPFPDNDVGAKSALAEKRSLMDMVKAGAPHQGRSERARHGRRGHTHG